MTDQVYFIGYRAEQFTGWDGTGEPVQNGVSSTGYYLPCIQMNSSSILWKNMDVDSLSPLNFLFAIAEYGGGLLSSVITDGENCIVVDIQDTGNYTWYVSIYYGSYSNKTLTKGTLISKMEPATMTSGLYFITVSITSSNGVVYDTLVSQVSTSTSSTEVELVESTEVYSGSISSNIKKINSIFFVTGNQGNFLYTAVTNFDLTGAYIDYTQVSAEATYTDWTGTVSTLTNYPLVTSSTSNGLYAYNTGDQVTFTSAKSLTTGDGYTTPKCTFIDTTLMSSKDDSGFQAVPIVKNASTSTTYTMGSVATPTTTPTDYQWINYQNPSNLSDWTVSDVNTLEFGLKRSK